MPKKGGVPENLKPFKKGFDERRNIAGNPGSQSLKAIFDKLLESKITIGEAEKQEIVTKKEAIALGLLSDALMDEDPNVRMKAAKMIFENTDPIAKDVNMNHGVSDDHESPISIKIEFRKPESE